MEYYLWSYYNVEGQNPISGTLSMVFWGEAATLGYSLSKSTINSLESYNIIDSPFTYTEPTFDEIEAGFRGAADANYCNYYGC